MDTGWLGGSGGLIPVISSLSALHSPLLLLLLQSLLQSQFGVGVVVKRKT